MFAFLLFACKKTNKPDQETVTLNLPSGVTVISPAQINFSKIAKNTDITVKVDSTTSANLEEFKVNGVDKITELTGEGEKTFTFTISENTVITIKTTSDNSSTELTNKKRVENDNAELVLSKTELKTVNEELGLTLNGKNGSAITWVSSNNSILSNEGKVIELPIEETNITLTATLKLNDETLTKEFTIKVLAKEFTIELYNGAFLVETRKIRGGNILNSSDFPATSKTDYNFVFWYLESESNKALQNHKLASDIKLYAKFLDNIDYFLFSRTLTLDNMFTYTYDLDLVDKGPFNVPLPGAFYDGTVYYNENNEIPYLRDEITSGALIKDQHRIRFTEKNFPNTLNEVVYKHDKKTGTGNFVENNIENPYDKLYDYSIYAKVLFEYTKDDIINITKAAGTQRKYDLELKQSKSNQITSILTSFGNAAITKLTEGLAEANIEEYWMTITYEENSHLIKEYTYHFKIKVTGGSSTLDYKLTFVDQQEVPAETKALIASYIR